MSWEPIKPAPMNRRVLVCDDKGNVFIAKAATLRWRDETDRLIDRPRWWQSLPSPPSEEVPARRSTYHRSGRMLWLRAAEWPAF
jgi:hypothetical protein